MNDKQQLAAIGEQLAEMGERMGLQVQPLCMTKRIEELEAQVRVMAVLLGDLRPDIELHMHNSMVMKSDKGIDRCNNRLKRIDDALAGNLPEPVAPEGWQLVPCMPTPEMCDAYHRADNDWEDGWAWDDNGNRHWSPVYQWAAMLAAAPKPEAK